MNEDAALKWENLSRDGKRAMLADEGCEPRWIETATEARLYFMPADLRAKLETRLSLPTTA